MTTDGFYELSAIVDTLLGPDGCPWDREQTIQSLRSDLLEECYEAADAIDKNNMSGLLEELGDVLLCVVLMIKKAELSNAFTMHDVFAAICAKMVNRHSHVFGSDKAATAQEALDVWKRNKANEKAQKGLHGVMADIPAALPALMRAEKILVVANGDDGVLQEHDILPKIINDLQSLQKTPQTSHSSKALQEKIGSILLNFVAMSKNLGISSELSLTKAIEAFINRFA